MGPAVTSELASEGSRVNEGLFKEPTNRGHTRGGEWRRDRDLVVMEDVFICCRAQTHFSSVLLEFSVFVEEGCDPLCIRGRKQVHFVPVSAEWLVALNNKLTYTR